MIGGQESAGDTDRRCERVTSTGNFIGNVGSLIDRAASGRSQSDIGRESRGRLLIATGVFKPRVGEQKGSSKT